jgi:hypothetical protein
LFKKTCPFTRQERWYFVREGQKFTRKDITGETLKMEGTQELDSAMRQALVDSEDDVTLLEKDESLISPNKNL